MVVKATHFELIPVDLLDAVVYYGNWLEEMGFRVVVEPYDVEYPNTPVFRGVRNREHYFYEVSSTVNVARAEEWVKYGRASSQDTRYIVVIANRKSVSSASLTRLRALGVGVDLIEGSNIHQLCAAHDLSLNVDFPTVPRTLRRQLAKSRELFNQGHWKESFEDACLALETEAREHLLKAVRNSQATFMSDKGKPITHTEAQVASMTLGQLAVAFKNLVGPTQTQSRVAQALARINPQRVTVAHHKHATGRRAQALRTQVGKDLIVIVNSIKMLKSS